MKKTILIGVMLLAAVVTQAKDIKTLVVTTSPQMHCENCENKIKGNLRFEKGVKAIETNVGEQRVTIEYDADKTTEANLIAAFGKFGYEATNVNAPKTGEKQGCQKQGCGGCQQKAEGAGCCQAKQAQSGCCQKKAEGTDGCQAKQAQGSCCKKEEGAKK